MMEKGKDRRQKFTNLDLPSSCFNIGAKKIHDMILEMKSFQLNSKHPPLSCGLQQPKAGLYPPGDG